MEVDSEEYFKSYEDLEIHELMLKDKARNEAYRNAIFSNKELFRVSAMCNEMTAERLVAYSLLAFIIPSPCFRTIYSKSLTLPLLLSSTLRHLPSPHLSPTANITHE
jgi:hypothetical protein